MTVDALRGGPPFEVPLAEHHVQALTGYTRSMAVDLNTGVNRLRTHIDSTLITPDVAAALKTSLSEKATAMSTVVAGVRNIATVLAEGKPVTIRPFAGGVGTPGIENIVELAIPGSDTLSRRAMSDDEANIVFNGLLPYGKFVPLAVRKDNEDLHGQVTDAYKAKRAIVLQPQPRRVQG